MAASRSEGPGVPGSGGPDGTNGSGGPSGSGGSGGSGGSPNAAPAGAPTGERAAQPRRGTARALGLLFLTLIAPGSAQVIAGSVLIGVAALVVYVTIVAVSAGAAVAVTLDLASPGSLLAAFVDPDTLGRLHLLLLVLGAAWLALFVDAWRLGRTGTKGWVRRIVVACFALALAAATSGMFVTGAKDADDAKFAIRTVFHATKVAKPVHGRTTVLLLGGDAGPDRIGLRPDSITLLSIDRASGRTAMLSFPRNLQRVPFPAGTPMARAWPHGFDCGNECLLNAIYTWANGHRALFPRSDPNPGLTATRQAVEQLSGLPVNYYVMVDMAGFKDLVDAVGGITIDVPKAIQVAGLASPRGPDHPGGPRWVRPGRHHFDGVLALAYARSRTYSSDYHRMNRQRCVMRAMLRELKPTTVLTRFEDLTRAGTALLRTDIPASELGSFVDLAEKAQRSPVASLQFVPPLVVTAHPDFGLIRRKTAETVRRSETLKSTDRSALDLDTACG